MSSVKSRQHRALRLTSTVTPEVTLKAGETFRWSPHNKTITYKSDALSSDVGIWSLLHETAHALLHHIDYKTDFELLLLEVAAWEEAKNLSQQIDMKISEDYIQDCLDTYRDWLHRRCTCPTCGTAGLQHSTSEYHCHNCNSSWQVTAARFCRPYRRKLATKEKSPSSIKNQTTFR